MHAQHMEGEVLQGLEDKAVLPAKPLQVYRQRVHLGRQERMQSIDG